MSPIELLHPSLQYHIVNTLGWPGLRPAQAEAIEPVVSGGNALLLAPTAGGKTEAAAFPILSRMLTENWRGVSVLYVCPIRALLNNLEPRLARYANLVGRQAALWHGDVTQGQKRRVLRDLPDLLLITPESIEAMLVSRRIEQDALFAGLQAVVVDELHAFAGDDRGWHLLAILARLERIVSRPLQRVGLSATVGNPEELAQWLSVGGPVRIAGRSPLSTDAEVMLDYVGSLDNAATVVSRLHRGEKRLVFCDSRGKVEQLAAGLQSQGIRTFVSHSSLGLDARRQAEEAFARERDCVIVATSTLELGLDVGDLDRVIQIDAPSTVSSFLQRMGRTGRRPGTRRNCLFLATSDKALLRAAGLVRLWSEGAVEPVRPPALPLHLHAQQIMAMILQESGLAVSEVHPRLSDAFGAADPDETRQILQHMLDTGILANDGGVLGIGPKGERLFGRRNFMELLAAFTAPMMVTVMHGRQELGHVDPSTLAAKPGEPTVLLLAGRHWGVTSVDWRRRIAWAEPASGAGKSRWLGSSSALHFELCRAIQRCLADGQVPAALSARAARRMAEFVEEFAFLEGRTQAIVTDENGSHWWTFAGNRANAALAAVLASRRCAVRRTDDFGLDIDGPLPDMNTIDLDEAASEVAALGLSSQSLTVKFEECLPPPLVKTMQVQRYLDLASAMCILQEAPKPSPHSAGAGSAAGSGGSASSQGISSSSRDGT